MLTTYDVRIWKTQVYKGTNVTTYYVRWSTAGKPFKKPFRNKAQAESFRSGLVTAARKGEAFHAATGLPVSAAREEVGTSWYAFACSYVDLKWPQVAATTRRTIAEALTAVTVLLLADDRGRPDAKLLRSALTRWAFNTARRDNEQCPDNVRAALQWVKTHTRPVGALADAGLIRDVLDGIALSLDGKPRSPAVVSRWRKIFGNAIEYAIERRLLADNPIPTVQRKAKAVRVVQAIDRRSVVNPVQARTLLKAVAEQEPSGPRLVAYFGCLYFAGLRPEEAAALSKSNLSLPAVGWGELHLERARPFAGSDWTDTGEDRDERQLKQRAVGEVRTVPCPPELTTLLQTHLERFGTTPDGRLFTGVRNSKSLPRLTVRRLWVRARATVFTDVVAASPLGATPYDLRHAAVSTWLNAGIPATDVAEWAGHSVDILLRIYAKCLDGGGATMRARIDEALGGKGRPAAG
jgi:integrase